MTEFTEKTLSRMKQNILSQVSDYILFKHGEREWRPGIDWVHYSKPFFDDKEYIASISSLLDEWLVLGNDAIKFENLFPPHLGKKYGILTNSGSSANLLMMMALKSKRNTIKHNSKVIVPIAGFPTTINPIFHAGYEPIFVDIELTTLNLNLDELEEVARHNQGSILTFAHVLGNPTDMDRLMDIVSTYRLTLLEDCCDSLNSKWDGKLLGSFGKMATCSFYPAHHITMGEGGFIATESPELEIIVRSLRDWGRGCYCVGEKANLLKNGTCKCRFNQWLPSLPEQIFDHKYVYEEIGFNLKPIELQASMGLMQLEKLDEITKLRKRNFNLLYDIFQHYNRTFHLPSVISLKADPNWFAFPLTVKDSQSFTAREFCMYLEDNKIQTRPYFGGNLMLQPAYDTKMTDYTPHYYKEGFPIATKVTTDTFFLGTSPAITPEQIEYIGKVVNKFFEGKH